MRDLENLCVLIVEDDENKKDRIQQFYQESFKNDCISWTSALVPGLRMAKKINPDFIILDMTIPNYETGVESGFNPMHPFGGREFLRQAARLKIKSKIVVVTQFETFGAGSNLVDLTSLDTELRTDFPDQYIGSIYYHASTSAWKKKLCDARLICVEKLK